ncbi:LCP family protein [Streptomyces sp. ISL-11]|uniref:LCP family protein n=1 Tax=Streptomyces sp. ISL-11 TaxID=2819174 RepID=UPI001BE69452|nr:LCP family protein [Streptomyces sp. ISL-11]MBT2386832.1 LCP family protein [Streptomyces sp. ISL-11]
MTAPARSQRPQRARHGAPRRRRWGLRFTAVAAVGVLGTAGLGHAVATRIENRIDRVDAFRGLSNRPPETRQGMNVLLVGTDGRDRITRAQRRLFHLGGAACHCADTLMLVHLSADHDRVTVVSLPRDTYAEIPEHIDEKTGRTRPVHPQKLNAAYAEGGPSLTVRTVERLTRVHVDHYLEVDFASFMETVDVLGGVRVCTAKPLQDIYSGLNLPAGTSSLNGGQALQYVRSRHLDGAADLGRMHRQQRFLASLLHKATDSGVLLNPVTFQQVSETLLGSVRADRGFGSGDLIGLGRALRNLTPASAEFVSVPVGTANFPVPRIGSTVRWDEAAAGKLFQSLREDRPLTDRAPRHPHDVDVPGRVAPAPVAVPVEVAPGQIHVQVLNGSGRAGLGRTTDQALRATGFRTTGLPADARGRVAPARTVITYDPRWDRSARSLAVALPGAELRPVPGQGPLMRLTLGTDFKEVRPVRAQDPAAGKDPAKAVTGDQVLCPESA